MTIYNEYGRRIEEQIRPSSYPIAVKLIDSDQDIPKDAKMPRRDYGACMATCQCFALSRKYGETVAQVFEDMWCPEPVIGFGFRAPSKYFVEGHNRYPGGVVSLEAGANWAKGFPRLEAGRHIGLVSAPLRMATFEPDVAVIYCNSAQLLRLLLGIAYEDGRDVDTVLSGHAACVYAVVPAILNGKCQVAVPCRGDRGRAGAYDDEMIFSVPKTQIGRLAHGLEQNGTGHYPTGISMVPEYELSTSYAELARQLGMKKADCSEIRGNTDEERKRSLQYR